MKTRFEAMKSLWRDWKNSALEWWRRRSGPEGQTEAWIAAAGAPAALIGVCVSPRTTIAVLAAAWIWIKIEKRRKT